MHLLDVAKDLGFRSISVVDGSKDVDDGVDDVDDVDDVDEVNDDVDAYGNSYHIQFIKSFTDRRRCVLLSRALAVLYTPCHEHFGIVPVEAMVCGVPVIATASGVWMMDDG